MNTRVCLWCAKPLIGRRPQVKWCNIPCQISHKRREKEIYSRVIPALEEPLCGTFQVYQDALANKFDVIITDPPYGRDYETLYKNLAQFAETVLVPGGWIICLTGYGLLREALNIFHETSLEYITIGTYWMPNSTMQASKRLSTGERKWRQRDKPMLWYQKPGKKTQRRRAGGVSSVIGQGSLDRKEFHWQQCLDAYKEIIGTFTNMQDVICDPCMGSGTTLIAAHEMGRSRVLGIEKDPETFLLAKNRIDSHIKGLTHD